VCVCVCGYVPPGLFTSTKKQLSLFAPPPPSGSAKDLLGSHPAERLLLEKCENDDFHTSQADSRLRQIKEFFFFLRARFHQRETEIAQFPNAEAENVKLGRKPEKTEDFSAGKRSLLTKLKARNISVMPQAARQQRGLPRYSIACDATACVGTTTRERVQRWGVVDARMGCHAPHAGAGACVRHAPCSLFVRHALSSCHAPCSLSLSLSLGFGCLGFGCPGSWVLGFGKRGRPLAAEHQPSTSINLRISSFSSL
jgi:hypothetical protein